MKKLIILIILIIILIFSIFYKSSKNNKIINKNNDLFKSVNNYNNKLKYRYYIYYKNNKNLKPEEVVTRVNIGLDKPFYTNTKPSPYLNKIYILVNKYLYLNKNYIPNNLVELDTQYSKEGMKLVKEAKDMFEKMYNDAKNEGYNIRVMSSYRDYNYQYKLYNKYKNQSGKNLADTYSARAGYSEHQTGLCVDIDDKILSYENFEQSNSYTWMKKNSYKYGFIERYPKGKEGITGYKYEPWHYRYVGTKIAKYINKNNITFDEYYVKNIKR